MTITPISAGGTAEQTRDLRGTVFPDLPTASIELNSGYYNLLFTLSKADNRTVRWTEILHVYQNQESAFVKTFSDELFNENIRTITYKYNDGITAEGTESCVHGTALSRPIDPRREPYIFNGWYADELMTAPYDFNDPVSDDVTLYAKWDDPLIRVTQSGSAIPPNGEYDFGALSIHQIKDITFTITNDGEAALSFGANPAGQGIYLEGEAENAFEVITQIPSETVIPPGESIDFSISFKPTIEKPLYNRQVVISYNSPLNTLFRFPIKGVSKAYEIGDVGPAGGMVFYNEGSYADNNWRYIEAAPSNTEATAQWGANGWSVGGTGMGIGTGKANTAIIVDFLSQRGESGKAAQICDALVYGGYDDWFLPSYDEVGLMYKNLKARGLGNFRQPPPDENSWYWTSKNFDTSDSAEAYVYRFNEGVCYGQGKTGWYTVRAARYF